MFHEAGSAINHAKKIDRWELFLNKINDMNKLKDVIQIISRIYLAAIKYDEMKVAGRAWARGKKEPSKMYIFIYMFTQKDNIKANHTGSMQIHAIQSTGDELRHY
jgi:hypothetical protein